MTTILDYGLLSKAVYDQRPAVDGWTLTQFQDSLGVSLQAGVFTRGQTTVVAFKGTSLSNMNDIVTDLKLGAGINTAYFSAAERFVDLHASGPDVVFTGHSLGGAIAQVVGNRRRMPFITFNAPGVAILASRNLHTTTAHMMAVRVAGGVIGALRHPLQTARDINAALHVSLGVNYRLDFDPVSAIGLHYGDLVTMACDSPLGERHSMSTVLAVLGQQHYGSINFPA